MKLKQEYKDLDFENKMCKRIYSKLGAGSPSKLNEFLERYNSALEKARTNDWLETYKVLGLLVEKLDIRYTLLQIKDEILNETILCFVWLVLDNAGKITTDIHFRYETKTEYNDRINGINPKQAKAVIEVEKKHIIAIERILNNTCYDWDERIIIRGI